MELVHCIYCSASSAPELEGDRPVIEALYERIARDRRHKRTTMIIVEPIAERAFSQWTMGCPTLSAGELAQIPGLNDFFTRRTSYLELGEGRAKALLAAFTEGRWRTSLA
jgi:pyruvate-formate lyase-activating enzyme